MAEKADVIVVGAGLAGIAAAHHLRAAGLTVIVLEARSAAGGRTRASQALSHPVDLGASWLHGTRDHPLYDMALALGLEYFRADEDSLKVFREDGTPEPVALDVMDTFERALEKLGRKAARRDSVADRLHLLPDELNSALPETLRQFLLTTVLEEEYAASVDDLAAAALEEGRDMRGADAILKDAYASLLKTLLQDLDVRLNCVVECIDYRNPSVTVSTSTHAYTAKQVIVTAPLGVLKAGDIRFKPRLPTDHQRAIDALGMGLTNKLFLEFPEVFWDASIQVVGYQNSQRGRWMSWYDYSAVTGAPILLGFCTAQGAKEVEALDDDATVADAMAVLRRIYGNSVPAPESWVITRWGQDPFSRGAYSYLKAGAKSSQRKTLASPLAGRLLLAGEHTDRRYPATTHGAWRAGSKAAKRVLKLRGKK
ncbi:MAG: NAD(P)/FAD-dependent oxidoreductase [Halieaceae bacterium]|jgi:monoamine oxidase|nr:NAD(P)/FAD-dependent oxidoreductase [Halieaceae bacterium]